MSTQNTLTVKQITESCPEQYEIFFGDRQVAYIRLRFNRLTVDCPDVRGQEIYAVDISTEEDLAKESDPFIREFGRSCFREEEREYFLGLALGFILNWMNTSSANSNNS